MTAKVVVSLVTYDSAPHLDACLRSLESQTLAALDVRLWDNASRDETLKIAGRHGTMLGGIHKSDRNVGFCAAHNRNIASTSSEYVLVMNPDVVLEPDFAETLAGHLDRDPAAGSATGRLYRWSPEPLAGGQWPLRKTLDTTGIYMTRNQRHLDRGSGQRDRGQYERVEYVFGASGAAAFFRRAMLEDAGAGGKVFDETFFAYREDADLAWRAQWLGWRCLYVPSAIGYHVRRVLPERRSSLPADINMHSFKNRFLLRIRNMDAGTYCRLFLPITLRDLAALAYVLVRERSSLRAFPLIIRALPGEWAARRELFRRRRVSAQEIRSWFSDSPRAIPIAPPSA
ncbi:MAG: glycosyltransferase family 2 protein [Acidobacteria bacterium]|nr:glycosyltransferase family 2 protein [Acidobacteriota bacterium]